MTLGELTVKRSLFEVGVSKELFVPLATLGPCPLTRPFMASLACGAILNVVSGR